MKSRMRTVGLAVGSLALLGAGCAHEQENAVVSSQAQSQKALGQAADAQRKATDAQKSADAEQARVEKMKVDLAKAQGRAERDRLLAQRSQKDAIFENQRAQEATATLQQQAVEQQKQVATGVETSTTQVHGTVVRAGNREIAIAQGNAEPLKLRVDSDTVVMLNGQPSFASNLTPGLPVRAAYRPGAALPIATRIDAGKASMDAP